MTVKEAAETLHVSTGTVYQLIDCGKLPCHRLGARGRKIYLDPADVETYWTSTKTVAHQAVKSSGYRHLRVQGV